MDVSLDDYIGTGNFSVQISNIQTSGRGRGGFQQRGQGSHRGAFKGSVKGRLGINRGQQCKPFSVTVSGNQSQFDARNKIAIKRPVDAREKLSQKARNTDARVKITNIKAQKGNDITINSDARNKLIAKRKGTGINITLGSTHSAATGNTVTRTINNNKSNAAQNTTTDFQITRTIDGAQSLGDSVKLSGNNLTISRGQVMGSGVHMSGDNLTISRRQPVGGDIQMSGDNLTITRPVYQSPAQEQNLPLSHVISNLPVHHNTAPSVTPKRPVMQLQHPNVYQPSPYHYTPMSSQTPVLAGPVPQPVYFMGSENTYYEDEESEEYPTYQEPQPVKSTTATYLVEKTLTVKKPQLLSPKSQSTSKSSNIISLKSGSVSSRFSQKSIPISTTKRKAPVAQSSGPLKLAKSSEFVSSVGSKRLKVVKQEDELESEIKGLTGSANSPLGFRVIVSNLHAVVSQDDIIELFGAIGPMKKARLVKAGVAEVVYIEESDAQKAITKYHNRELDGQPMFVKMYSPPSPPKKVTPENILGNVKDVEGPLRLGQNVSKKGSDLDVGVLHRVLFKAGNSGSNKPVTFTVKV